MEKWTIKNIPDLSGKTIIVTGGNSGLGYESVKAFAGKGAHVILACRNQQKGAEAKSSILNDHPDAKIDIMELDLMDLSSVENFATRFKQQYDKLDVLLNNAGIMLTPYFKTKNGFEAQVGTNHLGHFALTGQLLDLIKKTKSARVVNVSSGAHRYGQMDFDNLLFENGNDYTPMKAYGRSKLANLLFAYQLQRLFESHNIDAISVASHPGGSRTNLDRHVSKKFWFKLLKPIFLVMSQSQQQGALTQIRAAVDPDVKGGQYYGPHKNMTGHPVIVESNEDSHNLEDAKSLWQASEELTGIRFDFN